jgi:SHAQKYF class myb-like DNA-binding protein
MTRPPRPVTETDPQRRETSVEKEKGGNYSLTNNGSGWTSLVAPEAAALARRRTEREQARYSSQTTPLMSSQRISLGGSKSLHPLWHAPPVTASIGIPHRAPPHRYVFHDDDGSNHASDRANMSARDAGADSEFEDYSFQLMTGADMKINNTEKHPPDTYKRTTTDSSADDVDYRNSYANASEEQGEDYPSRTKRPLGGVDGPPVQKAKLTTQYPNEAWSESTHRRFVESIYEIGVKHASPSVILENMTCSHDALTSERVKSHLQKYRNNKDKSKEEFFFEYDGWLQKALTVGAAGGANSSLVPPASIVEIMGTDKLLGGDVAALLSYSTMAEEDFILNNTGALGMGRSSSNDLARLVTGARIPFPVLSEDERKSPLGISISHVVSLFYSMTQCITKERLAKADGEPDESPEVGGEATNNSEWKELGI